MPVHDGPWPQGTPCWVDCQVDDPVKESEFYASLFGWAIEGGGEEAGGYLMAMKDGQSVAGIGPKPQAGMMSVWTTYFAADDADEIAAKVADAGGQVMMTPFDVLDAGRMFVGSDTTGAVFGVWQARAHNGAAVHNEHGAYCWNELHTRQLDTAERFYADVFGYTYEHIGDGATMRYAMFTPPGAEQPAGGMNDDTLMPGEPMPSYWMTWFQYDNVDEGLGRARELGATVMMPATDSPVGRMAIVAAPQGEAFGIIDTNVRVGEM
ncbi:VOC family protein [Nocardia sp. CDC159]|uniref:VOC family protein n=1 Tax=Nocardia pulmonis TaxID=2951408 RepID=A0A9X2E7R4_9NOCA|nr:MULTISPECIES: VOC family protein [Nocardia]MCM6775161.1 VOC family protein [Nocardia pulmonis]MCM6789631.1 VOC family protein [Nocardia sp. CDC159]